MINTANVDKDTFLYEVPYIFASSNIAASLTAQAIPANSAFPHVITSFTVPRGSTASPGRIVGMSIAELTCTSGAATFDVTINDVVSGIRAIISPTTQTASGNYG